MNLGTSETNSNVFARMTKALQAGDYPNIHSVLISHKGALIYEEYFGGTDELNSQDIGKIDCHKDYVHDVRSISKLVVSACAGIAIERGYLSGIRQMVLEFFPNCSPQAKNSWEGVTIEHLLTMTSGMVWNEPVPSNDPANSEVLMLNSPDPIAYVLNSKRDIPPGKEWRYNGGNTQLLAHIIQQVSGLTIDMFAKQHLFYPMGITDYEWTCCPNSKVPAAASGLRMKSKDMLKLGLLYTNKGQWQNRQVVPESWIADSLMSRVDRSATESYGYAFWIWEDTFNEKPLRLIAAPGNGDQRIYIEESHDLVVVVTAGNYDNWEIEKNSYALLKEFVLPVVM